MIRRPLLVIASAIVGLLAGCDTRTQADGTAGDPVDTPPPAAETAETDHGVPASYVGELPSLAALNIRDARIDAVATGFDRPWAFEFLADDEVIISEIGGRLLRQRLDGSAPIQLSGVPAVATDQEQTGLLDVALHPRFVDNRRVYLSDAAADPASPRYYRTELATGFLVNDALIDVEVILDSGPYGWSPSNFGGALAFDADGYLYVTIGDRSESALAQRGDRLEGKLLRLHDDGATPSDNPFVDDATIDDRIYALGLRNEPR